VDRVISIEMMEHCKNTEKLAQRISTWLKPGNDGKFFFHIFTHRTQPYHFLPDSWMGKNFFTGGTMPSDDTPLYMMTRDLLVQDHWVVNGIHYAKTCQGWLANMDNNRTELMRILRETYGEGNDIKWWCNWRIFFLACEELFAFNDGNEWVVTHYLFTNRPSSTSIVGSSSSSSSSSVAATATATKTTTTTIGTQSK